MISIPFEEFPKIPRLKRECVITEKVDGSNAQIFIRAADADDYDPALDIQYGDLRLRAGSRTRWIGPGKDTDNFGFAVWAHEHCRELLLLGEGHHFGEWYGAGIQRTYGLDHKRFALFNTARWNPLNPNKPPCCDVVPVLHTGPLGNADQVVEELRTQGSRMVPGFMRPEGIVVYHSASRQLFKQMLEYDDEPKSKREKPPKLKDPNVGGRRVGLAPGYAGPERRVQ